MVHFLLDLQFLNISDINYETIFHFTMNEQF